MQQATQSAVPAAPVEGRDSDPQRLAFQHAHMVTGDIVGRLAVQPFAVEIQEDFPSGWRIHLKFRSAQTAGLLDFARMLTAPVTTAVTQFGVHVECLARLGDVELRASALLSHEEATALNEQAPTVHLGGQEDGDQLTWPAEPSADAAPVPLGESPASQDEPDPYDQSMDRYAASLGGNVGAQTPAVEAPAADDPSTIAFARVAPAAGGDR
ncbi:hypothetical protein PV516_01030 [Streptomyces scabiei]|uniref:hypothetical protein n=1 Tax=Streptomyces scabiei TaxID=1930 RepID=UPI0029A4C525|nr:hypothetical protein [Streptomyces scabiei]MDX3162383.1 hypothetical protein [Streptomyces scabiei]